MVTASTRHLWSLLLGACVRIDAPPYQVSALSHGVEVLLPLFREESQLANLELRGINTLPCNVM